MEKSRRLNTDPVTGDVSLEIVETVDVKRTLFEKDLLIKKEYLEGAIVKFQAELVLVNEDLKFIDDEKNIGK